MKDYEFRRVQDMARDFREQADVLSGEIYSMRRELFEIVESESADWDKEIERKFREALKQWFDLPLRMSLPEDKFHLIEDVEGYSLLHMMALYNRSKAVMVYEQERVVAGISPDGFITPDQKNGHGDTVLHIAAEHGDAKFIRTVGKLAVFNPGILDRDGKTAAELAYAGKSGNPVRTALKEIQKKFDAQPREAAPAEATTQPV